MFFDIAAVFGVVAEEADEGSIEKLRKFHGDFEAVEMHGPGLGNFYFTDGRTDDSDSEAVVSELGFYFSAQRGVKIEDVLIIDAAQLEMGNSIGFAEFDLLVEMRGDFIGEGC